MRAITAFAFAAVLALSAAPASAKPFNHHHGFWGPGLIFGLAGAAIAASIAAEHECYRTVAVYDDWGNYIGSRRVNEC